VKIETGASESHPTPLPVDTSHTPRVAPPAPVASVPNGPTIPGRDTTGEYQAQLRAGEGDVRAAQAAGMTAEHGRRDHYGSDVLPAGASYGDLMSLPPVPDNAVPPANSFGYPFPGLEPTPAQAGSEGIYGGN
jgi:hypothetical protein